MPFHYHLVPGKLRKKIGNLILKFGYRDKFFIGSSGDIIRYLMGVIKGGTTHPNNWLPSGYKVACLFTHDVDSKDGIKNIEKIREIERNYDIKSWWSFLSNKYRLPYKIIEKLIEQGCEIGSHGYNHDNKLPLLSGDLIRKRLEKSKNLLKDYKVIGFRSPSLERNRKLFSILSEYFLYDSSVPDIEKGRGCLSVFPFWKGELLELPITIPVDMTLLIYGYKPDEILKIWIDKFDYIYKLGGLVNILVHPESFISGNKDMLLVYEKFIQYVKGKGKCWNPLPYQLYNWLRKLKRN